MKFLETPENCCVHPLKAERLQRNSNLYKCMASSYWIPGGTSILLTDARSPTACAAVILTAYTTRQTTNMEMQTNIHRLPESIRPHRIVRSIHIWSSDFACNLHGYQEPISNEMTACINEQRRRSRMVMHRMEGHLLTMHFNLNTCVHMSASTKISNPPFQPRFTTRIDIWSVLLRRTTDRFIWVNSHQ